MAKPLESKIKVQFSKTQLDGPSFDYKAAHVTLVWHAS